MLLLIIAEEKSVFRRSCSNLRQLPSLCLIFRFSRTHNPVRYWKNFSNSSCYKDWQSAFTLSKIHVKTFSPPCDKRPKAWTQVNPFESTSHRSLPFSKEKVVSLSTFCANKHFSEFSASLPRSISGTKRLRLLLAEIMRCLKSSSTVIALGGDFCAQRTSPRIFPNEFLMIISTNHGSILTDRGKSFLVVLQDDWLIISRKLTRNLCAVASGQR